MLKITPSFSRFCELAKKGNTIPVYAEIMADLETPVSSYLKTHRGEEGFLLESVEGGRSQARYSFVGLEPETFIIHEGRETRVITKGRVTRRFKTEDPLKGLKETLSKYRYVETSDLPRFCGGAVGYLSYECNRFFEKSLKARGKAEFPDVFFMVTRKLLVFDHLMRRMKIVVNVQTGSRRSKQSLQKTYQEAVRDIETMLRRLEHTELETSPRVALGAKRSTKVKSNFTAPAFKKAVRRIQKQIHQGEAIQVVLSQRFERSLKVPAFDIYRSLRSVNPSPYMFYLDCGPFKVIGSSPETHVRCEQGKVELRPIAGTRPRGSTPEKDQMLAEQLKEDPKECAEHVMLVDLGRNDLGRVCQIGSVHVSEFMNIERYSHVMHIVSHVEGALDPKKDLYDVIRATFPAGTVSGAPKVRAMEIIADEEPGRRGPYAGLVGYLSFSGNFDSCITIRTMLVKDGTAYVQAGAGIVADSKPQKEWEETCNKAKGLLHAIDLAERGLK